MVKVSGNLSMVIKRWLLTACQPDLDIPEETSEPRATDAPEAKEEAGLSGQIQIAGSTTVQSLAEVLSEAFMADNPDVTIEIQGGGSSVGVTLAGERTVDIGNASRNVKDSEFEVLTEQMVHTIAYDGISIVSIPDLELPSLSIEWVKAIFAGEIANDSEIGGPAVEIVVVSLQEGAGTRAALWDEVKETLDKSALALSSGQQQPL